MTTPHSLFSPGTPPISGHDLLSPSDDSSHTKLALAAKTPRDLKTSFVKIVEMQRRGAPHFLAVIRLDQKTESPNDSPQRPHTAITSAMLATLAIRAATIASIDINGSGGEIITLRFGAQTDAQPLDINRGQDHQGIVSDPVRHAA